MEKTVCENSVYITSCASWKRYVIEHFYLQFLIQLLKNSQNYIVLFRGQKKCLNLLYSVIINATIIKTW